MSQNYVNKFIIDGQTRLDLSEDTITPETLASGITAHDAEGKSIVGTMTGGGVIVSDTTDAAGGTIREITALDGPVMLQPGSATPSTSAQSISPPSGYNGFNSFTVAAIPSEYVVPTGTSYITSNGTYNVAAYASANVSVGANLSGLSVTPTESSQQFSPGGGYAGYNAVSVAAISSNYVGSNVARKSSTDLIVSGPTVTAPAGYYASNATQTVAAGSLWPTIPIEGTDISVSVDSGGYISAIFVDLSGVSGSPVRSDGWLTTNDTVSIIHQEYGYLQLSTQSAATIVPSTSAQTAVASGKYTTGAVTVAAIPSSYIVPSGTKEISITATGTKTEDVTAYASAKIITPAGTATTPATSITANPTISFNTTTGAISATVSKTQNVTPTVSSGWVASGTSGTITISGSSSTSLTIRTTSDLSANGAYINVPSGYYASDVSKAVGSGSATTPTKTITANPTISVNTTTGVITASVAGSSSITPTVSAGYVSSGTAGTVSVSGSNTSSLSTQNGSTITPTESEQTAVAANKYTLGAVKIAAISSNYVGSNVTQRTSSDVGVSGPTISIPSGYYANDVSKSVSTAAKPDIIITYNSATRTVTATVTFSSATGTVGWMTAGSVSASSVIATGITQDSDGFIVLPS